MPSKIEFPLDKLCTALTMYVMDKPISRITEETGIRRPQLYRLLRERNIPLRHEGKSRGQRVLGPEQMRQVAELYNQHVSVNDIAKQLSVGRSLIYTTLHELGVKVTVNDDGRTSVFSTEQKKDIVWLYEQSRLTAPQIASIMGSSVTPVYVALKEAGIVRRTGRSGPKKHFVKYAAENGRISRFQSTWEEAFAKHLDKRGLDWAHESHTWLLSDGTAYTPDFWVPDWNVFVEVKGFMFDEARRKINLFRQDYPHLRLLVLDRKALETFGIKQVGNFLVA